MEANENNRIIIVSNSLPHSLMLEKVAETKLRGLTESTIGSAVKVPTSRLSEDYLSDKSKNILNDFYSQSHKKLIDVAKSSSFSKMLNESDEMITPRIRRTRSFSGLNMEACINSLTLSGNEMTELKREEAKKLVWKFLEMKDHPANAAVSGLPNWNKVFIGWPGPFYDENENQIEFNDLTPGTLEKIKEIYWKECNSIPIFLDSKVANDHLNGFCKGSLWPLFHYILWENINELKDFDVNWEAYVKVNEEFTEKILESYKPGDISIKITLKLMKIVFSLDFRLSFGSCTKDVEKKNSKCGYRIFCINSISQF
jgi:trehalose-6-phosphate synthase